MKLAKPLVWKSGLVALGVLSVVSLHSVGAQTTTNTPTTGSSVTTPANGTNGNGVDSDNDNGGYGNNGDTGGNWNSGQGGMMGGQGGMMGGRHGGHFGGEKGARVRGNYAIGGVSAQAIATYLGLTTEQLKADLDAGQSLAQIAVAQGKTRDDLRTFMIQQSTAAIDSALDQTVTSKANGNGATAGGNGTTANSTPSAAATPSV